MDYDEDKEVFDLLMMTSCHAQFYKVGAKDDILRGPIHLL